jgi:hypothetical protein
LIAPTSGDDEVLTPLMVTETSRRPALVIRNITGILPLRQGWMPWAVLETTLASTRVVVLAE